MAFLKSVSRFAFIFSVTQSTINHFSNYWCMESQRNLTPLGYQFVHLIITNNLHIVSTAADRPARRRSSAHAKYSISHHTVIQPFLLLDLAAEYRSHQWLSSTVVRWPSDHQRNATHDFLRYINILTYLLRSSCHWQTKLTVPETISHSREMVHVT